MDLTETENALDRTAARLADAEDLLGTARHDPHALTPDRRARLRRAAARARADLASLEARAEVLRAAAARQRARDDEADDDRAADAAARRR